MPNLFKRANGKYYIYYERAGKRKWKSTGQTRRPDALRELAHFEEYFNEHIAKYSFEDFTKEFLEYCSGTFSPKTQTIYRSALVRFGHVIGDKPLAAIIAKDADRYRTLRAAQVAPVSVNVDLRTLKAAFYTAMRWEMIARNPFKGIGMMRVPDQMPIYFSKDDFDKFLSVIDDVWFREVVIVGVLTGLRRGELLALKWGDVDFTHRMLHIHSSESIRTKGGKRRSVPMNDTVDRMLRRRREEAEVKVDVKEKVKVEVEKESVFNAEHKADIGHIVTKKFKNYVLKARLDARLHFHSLRHTFATWLVQGGVSIYEVQKLLGHSSITVTQVYSHLASSELFSAVGKISINFD